MVSRRKIAFRYLKRASDPIEALKEHLNPSGPVEKGRDLVDNLTNHAVEWLMRSGEKWIDDIEEASGKKVDQENLRPSLTERLVERKYNSWDLPDGLYKDFFEWAEGNGKILRDPKSPSWMHMDYRQDVSSDEWLVHRTDGDAQSICSSGFEKGVADPSKLGITTRIDPALKSGDGYNFAFLVHSSSRSDNFHRIGDQAIIFQPGPEGAIQVYHHGDRENQVIFWGPSATNMVCLREVELERGETARTAWKPIPGGLADSFDVELLDHPFGTLSNATTWAETLT